MTMKKGDDPADHNVEDVKVYLSHASADEIQRVALAEEKGKNRAGVLDAIRKDATMETTTGHSVAAGRSPDDDVPRNHMGDPLIHTVPPTGEPGKPVWDVTTHGPIDEAKRDQYSVVGE